MNGAISANNGRVIVHQTVTDAAIPAFEIEQLDTDQPFIRFTGGTIYDSKTPGDEFIMINVGGTTKHIQLCS